MRLPCTVQRILTDLLQPDDNRLLVFCLTRIETTLRRCNRRYRCSGDDALCGLLKSGSDHSYPFNGMDLRANARYRSTCRVVLFSAILWMNGSAAVNAFSHRYSPVFSSFFYFLLIEPLYSIAWLKSIKFAIGLIYMG